MGAKEDEMQARGARSSTVTRGRLPRFRKAMTAARVTRLALAAVAGADQLGPGLVY